MYLKISLNDVAFMWKSTIQRVCQTQGQMQ